MRTAKVVFGGRFDTAIFMMLFCRPALTVARALAPVRHFAATALADRTREKLVVLYAGDGDSLAPRTGRASAVDSAITAATSVVTTMRCSLDFMGCSLLY